MRYDDFIRAGHHFLDGLKAEHLVKLSDVAMPVRFEQNEVIFRQGEVANRFYLILSGTIAVEAEDSLGNATTIQKLSCGDLLGWSWMIPPERWEFTARALAPSTAIFLYGTRLREACECDPELGYEILKRISLVLVTRLQSTRRLLLDQIADSRKQPTTLDSPLHAT